MKCNTVSDIFSLWQAAALKQKNQRRGTSGSSVTTLLYIFIDDTALLRIIKREGLFIKKGD